jgi:hypothetical protein
VRPLSRFTHVCVRFALTSRRCLGLQKPCADKRLDERYDRVLRHARVGGA